MDWISQWPQLLFEMFNILYSSLGTRDTDIRGNIGGVVGHGLLRVAIEHETMGVVYLE